MAKKVKNADAPIRGVEHGSYIGPTGRKRKYYTVIAHNRQNERRGSDSGYGVSGMREAKKAITRREEKHHKRRTWLKFYVHGRRV